MSNEDFTLKVNGNRLPRSRFRLLEKKKKLAWWRMTLPIISSLTLKT